VCRLLLGTDGIALRLGRHEHRLDGLRGRADRLREDGSLAAGGHVRESIHAAIEEQFVYPLVRRKVDGGDELADHAIEEHQEVKSLLADIEKLSPEQADFAKKMEQVMSSVTEHVEEEEGDLLPKLKDVTAEDTRDKVGSLAEKAKSLVPTHPHPLVPGTATAQLIAGPWAGMVDRVRDLLAG
jgi:hemerythrin superfamily protein